MATGGSLEGKNDEIWILNRKKAQNARRQTEKAEKGANTVENEQDDDFSWYFNRQIDDPLERLESYENEVEKEYL